MSGRVCVFVCFFVYVFMCLCETRELRSVRVHWVIKNVRRSAVLTYVLICNVRSYDRRPNSCSGDSDLDKHNTMCVCVCVDFVVSVIAKATMCALNLCINMHVYRWSM